MTENPVPRRLKYCGGEPDACNENEPCPCCAHGNGLRTDEHEKYGRRGLGQHRRADDEGREAGVGFGVDGETIRTHAAEKWVVDDLDEPDYADHYQRRRQVDE